MKALVPPLLQVTVLKEGQRKIDQLLINMTVKAEGIMLCFGKPYF